MDPSQLSSSAGQVWNQTCFLAGLSTFFASAASTSELQTLILSNCSSGMDHDVQEIRPRWCSSNNTSCPDDESAARQRSWDAPGISCDWATLWNNCVTDLNRALLRQSTVATGFSLYPSRHAVLVCATRPFVSQSGCVLDLTSVKRTFVGVAQQ